MIIINLKGGLGNQMFQYSFGYALSVRFGTQLFLDHSFLEQQPDSSYTYREYALDIFNIQATRAAKKQLDVFTGKPSLISRLSCKIGLSNMAQKVQEPHYHFAAGICKQKRHYYLDGYWQSPLYFKEYENELRNVFVFNNQLLKTSSSLQERMVATESVCVHIRRGDFISSNFHVVCSPHYYLQAMDYMRQQRVRPHFFLFTDDFAWCKAIFGHLYDVEIVDESHNGIKYGNKLQLMTMCRHFILANSTYSWWAHWLANNPSAKVVAPKRWYADSNIDVSELFEKHWFLMDN